MGSKREGVLKKRGGGVSGGEGGCVGVKGEHCIGKSVENLAYLVAEPAQTLQTLYHWTCDVTSD